MTAVPVTHLDYIQVESVLQTLRRLASPGRLVIVATHDDRMVPLADRVVRLAEQAPTESPVTIEVAAGEVIFEQGSRGSLVYVVSSGEVELLRRRADGSEELLAVSRSGDYFGELGPILGFPRAATARARKSTVLTGYDVADFRALLGSEEVEQLLGRKGAKQSPVR